MNIPVMLPMKFELANTKIDVNGVHVVLEDFMEEHGDYFDTPIATMSVISDLFINGESSIYDGDDTIKLTLVAWGECEAPL